jgi:hypothetical protein
LAGIWPTCFDVLGAPFWKGTTWEAVDVEDPLVGGCTMTWVAVIVVPLVVPRTSTGSPAVTALTEAEVVPFSYDVEDASLTVTFWPADVVMVKPDVDRLPTVPTDPPAAGPDRALDPPPPDAGPAAEPPLAAGELLLTGAEPPPVAALTMP